jgi:hypothetical protein
MKRLIASVGRVIALGTMSAVILGGSATAIRAQTPTLGEVAKKEADRRKAQPSAGKVYTNKDLPASAQLPAGGAPASGQDTAAPVDPVAAATARKPGEAKPESGPKAEGETKSEGENKPEGETKDEAWWKNRIMSTREELRRNEMFAEALQTRINALSRDYTSRDNPGQRRLIGQERAESLTELSRVKQDVERGKKQIADIEEEARKAGVPPGWLR